MKIIKTLLTMIAADILALFIAMTLAVSGSAVLRAVSAICTAGVLVCVLGSFGAKQAKADIKERYRGHMPFFMGITASLPGIVSWLVLRFSGLDFYRWHKLINGWFLQLFNFIEPDPSSAALSHGDMWLMLPLCFVPAAVFLISYFVGSKRLGGDR